MRDVNAVKDSILMAFRSSELVTNDDKIKLSSLVKVLKEIDPTFSEESLETLRTHLVQPTDNIIESIQSAWKVISDDPRLADQKELQEALVTGERCIKLIEEHLKKIPPQQGTLEASKDNQREETLRIDDLITWLFSSAHDSREASKAKAKDAVDDGSGTAEGSEALRVRNCSGDVLLSLSREDLKGMTVAQLKTRVGDLTSRRREEVKVVLGDLALSNGDMLESFLTNDEPLELQVVLQRFPEFDKNRPASEQVLPLSGLLFSTDEDQMLYAATELRKMLSVERNPHISEVIEAGVVPRLLELAGDSKRPPIQFEALWAVTNIASGSSEQTQAVVDLGAIGVLERTLKDTAVTDDVKEQAVWAVGNIAGDSTRFRDQILGADILQPLLALISNPAKLKLSLLRNLAWSISNLTRGKPSPPVAVIEPAVRPLIDLLKTSKDNEVLTDVCWSLSYISDGTNDRIQLILEDGVPARLLELTQIDLTVATPALRTLGNIVTGEHHQTQAIVSEPNCFPFLLGLMQSNKKGIRKESCWAISNIMADSEDHVEAAINGCVLPPLVKALQDDAYDVKREAAWAIHNLAENGSQEHRNKAMMEGCLQPLVSFFDSAERDRDKDVAAKSLLKFIEGGGSTSEENPCFGYISRDVFAATCYEVQEKSTSPDLDATINSILERLGVQEDQ